MKVELVGLLAALNGIGRTPGAQTAGPQRPVDRGRQGPQALGAGQHGPWTYVKKNIITGNCMRHWCTLLAT